jgi:hypothetical protein
LGADSAKDDSSRDDIYKEIEEELSRHLKARYSDEKCPLCGSRIDENGLCACGAAS